MRLLSFLKGCFILILTLYLSNCGGGGGSGISVPAEVQDALDAANNLEETSDLMASSGSILGLRARMSDGFPEIETLISGTGDTTAALLAPFSGTPEPDQEYRLLIHAYALEQRGGASAVSTLQEFLEDNIHGYLYYTPHFVTHAIKTLFEDSDVEDTFYYSVEQMDDAVSASASLTKGSILGGAELEKFQTTDSRSNCQKRYILLDGNEDVIIGTDGNPITIQGQEWSLQILDSDTRTMWINRVIYGEGTYVDSDDEFQGSPTTSFNCGGYAFREFNSGKAWTAGPADIYKKLVTNSSVLRELEDGETPRQGDKVFYSDENGNVGHVAEVHSVDSEGNATIRNADNRTGLWEAAIDADYFTGAWIIGLAARYPTWKIYRWTDDSAPTAAADPGFVDDPHKCGNDPDAGSSGSTPTLEVTTCPSEMSVNSSDTLVITYSDAEGDIETLITVVLVDNPVYIDAYGYSEDDATSIMSGTSGTYTKTVETSGYFSGAEVTWIFTATDAEGNISSDAICSYTVN